VKLDLRKRLREDVAFFIEGPAALLFDRQHQKTDLRRT
jgi:hypothetical protein